MQDIMSTTTQYYSDSDGSSSNSSNVSTPAPSLPISELNNHPFLPSLPQQYQIPKSIMNALILPTNHIPPHSDDDTASKSATVVSIASDTISLVSSSLSIETLPTSEKNTNNSVIETESTNNYHHHDTQNLTLRRSKRKRDTTYDYRNRIDSLFNRKALEEETLDELLAKAMSFEPDLHWNVTNEWCRYCGARGSVSFYSSPWGQKQLCDIHTQMWTENRLDLDSFTEPQDIESVINPFKNTEREYLTNIICSNMYAAEDTDNSSSSEEWSSQEAMLNHNKKYSQVVRKQRVKHKTPNNPRGYPEYKCKECDVIIINSAAFKDHSLKFHGNHRPFECDRCEKNYISKSNLDYHTRKIHDKEINYHCSVCQKPFFDKTDMKSHMKVHNKIKVKPLLPLQKFVCAHCQQVFTRKYYLKKHTLNIHTANEDKPHQCAYCRYGAATKWQIDIHEAIHLNKRQWRCSHCNRGFNNKKNMERHVMNDHIKPFKCDKCDRGFGTKSYLESHVMNLHTANEDKPFHCAHCSYGSSSQKRVAKHEMTHSKLRPFKCGRCDKSFKSLSYLHSHLNRVHISEEEKKFVCNVCEKRFSSKSYLRNHVLSHSTIKPYKCPHCEYATQFKHRMEKHVMTHNTQKPYKCDLCHKRFRLLWYVGAHKKNMHPDGKLTEKAMPPKPKDHKRPKKPLSSYFLFAQEARPGVREEMRNDSVIEIAKAISRKWNQLREDGKKPYKEEAARLRREYEEDREIYKASDTYKQYEKKLNEWKEECMRIKQAVKKQKEADVEVNIKKEEDMMVDERFDDERGLNDDVFYGSEDENSTNSETESDSDASLSSESSSS